MIVTDGMMRDAFEGGGISVEPFGDKQIQAATYDLRIGDQAVTTSSKEVRNLREKGFVVFEPGDFGFVTTLEVIKLSAEYAGRFGLRSSFARKGLSATTGPQIDPGFHGRLIIGLTNLTPNPITLSHGDDFVSIEFHKLPQPAQKPYSGPNQDVTGLRPEDIAMVTEQKGMALSEMIKSLSSLSANVGTLSTEVKNLKWIFGLGLAALAILIAVVGLQ